MNKLNFKGVPTTVWVRIIGGIIAVANLISVSLFDFQLLPFADEQIYEGVSIILTAVMLVINTWKDTPVTAAAQEGHRVTKKLKKGVK